MRPSNRGFTLVQLVLSLFVIACLMLLPALVAMRVQANRIRKSHERVDALAATLRGGSLPRGGVLAGPGNAPTEARDDRWIAGMTAPLRNVKAQPDGWGNQLLVNAGGTGTIWVLSAGPNGIVETPFDGAQAGGDDIAARIR